MLGVVGESGGKEESEEETALKEGDTPSAEGPDALEDEGPSPEEATARKAAKKELEKPDSKTIEAHNRGGHVPFAPWCAHCRAAQATMQPHHHTPQEKEDDKE